MSGVFNRPSAPANQQQPPRIVTVPKSETATAPDPTAAPPAGAGLGETRAPVTRASTMLSNRRAGDDLRVGTKKLLGQ